MASRSVVLEAREITLAIELIELGARLQVLEAEVGLSRERLIKLYKEVRGVSPPKGMLPFSTDWFMTWQPNIHSSMFYNTYRFMVDEAGCEPIQATIRAYRLYLEHVALHGGEAVLGLTRAWTLLRFFDSGMLQSAPCSRCGGKFVVHAHDPKHGMVCGLCQPPSRAGKTRAGRIAADEAMAEDAMAEHVLTTDALEALADSDATTLEALVEQNAVIAALLPHDALGDALATPDTAKPTGVARRDGLEQVAKVAKATRAQSRRAMDASVDAAMRAVINAAVTMPVDAVTMADLAEDAVTQTAQVLSPL